MTKSLIALLILSAGPLAAQSSFGSAATNPPSDTTTAAPKSVLKYSYDKLTDSTTALSPEVRYFDNNIGRMFLNAEKPAVGLQTAVMFNGKANHDTITTVLLLVEITTRSNSDAIIDAGAMASVETPVRLLLDDSVRMSLTAHLTDNTTRFNTVIPHNTLLYIGALTVQQLQTIANAQTMEGSANASRFKFDRKAIQKLAAVRELLSH